jgi:hypothetical protein
MRGSCMQLPEIKVMETSVSRSRIGCVDASLPFLRPEEAVEVRHLARMADEPVDFFIHKVDEYLAATLRQNLSDQSERGARPSERIDEGECREEPAIALETRVELGERRLERHAAFNKHTEIRR